MKIGTKHVVESSSDSDSDESVQVTPPKGNARPTAPDAPKKRRRGRPRKSDKRAEITSSPPDSPVPILRRSKRTRSKDLATEPNGPTEGQKNKKSKVEVVIESPREANRKYKSDIENQRRTSVKNSKKKQAKEKRDDSAALDEVQLEEANEVQARDTEEEENYYWSQIESPAMEPCVLFDQEAADPAMIHTYWGLPVVQLNRTMIGRQGGPQSSFFSLSLAAKELGYDVKQFVRLATSSGNTVMNVANLARSDPKDFKFAKRGTYNTLYLMYKVNSTPALCYTFGVSCQDFSQTPLKFHNGKSSKGLSIIPQSLEIDRKVALICEVAGVEEYHASLWGNALSFQTRSGMWKEDGIPRLTASSPKLQKYATKQRGSEGKTSAKSVQLWSSLDVNEKVWVYDGRRALDLQLPRDLEDCQKLPEFGGQIPEGSLVFLTYTTNLYTSSTYNTSATDPTSVSHNIQFVVVLAAPDN